MKMKSIPSLLTSCFTLFIFICLIVSCGSEPQPVQSEPVIEPVVYVPVIEIIQQAPETPMIEEEVFDPATVSQEHYNITFDEVRRFIEELNRIIASSNYPEWRERLSPEYFSEISSPEFLRNTSESPILADRRITLRTPQDYFRNVVVPSRANQRVDEIEFISMYRVRAFTINTRVGREQWLILYDLEKIDDSWKIIN